MPRFVAAIASLVWIASSACGGPSTASPPAALPPPGARVSIEAIETLGDEIEQAERDAHLEDAAPAACYRRELASAEARCEAADVICSRARQICDRAEGLGEHPWADGRCLEASERCERARCHCVKHGG